MNFIHYDDDPLFSLRLKMLVAELLEVDFHHTDQEDECFSLLASQSIDGIFIGISSGAEKTSGLELLKKLSDKHIVKPIIVISSFSHGRETLSSLSLGVWDHLFKESSDDDIRLHLKGFLGELRASQLSSRSDTMSGMEIRIDKILKAGIDAVLLIGESGTGKELVASKLASKVKAAKQSFVAVNCASLQESLVESELFGHEKGSFTGAHHKKTGLFAEAAGGWVFLDEVARLSSGAQSALLRSIESKELRPLGSSKVYQMQTKILAATNEDLDDMVKKGLFRNDLLQRLKAVELHLPPFRDRSLKEREAILESLLLRLKEKFGKRFFTSHETASFLLEQPWEEGNIRQLWNTLQGMAIQADSHLLTLRHLPESVKKLRCPQTIMAVSGKNKQSFEFDLKKDWQSNQEAFFMAYFYAMRQSYGKEAPLSQLAKGIGLSRWALSARLKKSSRQYKENI